MARLSQAENENTVLSFRRERVADGVQLARIALRRGESSLFHHHTKTRDTFYVMKGRLVVTVKSRDEQTRPAYRVVRADDARAVTVDPGGPVTRVVLVCGDVLVLEPGVVHCAANLDEEPCEFLCIEGVGEYDFVLEDGV